MARSIGLVWSVRVIFNVAPIEALLVRIVAPGHRTGTQPLWESPKKVGFNADWYKTLDATTRHELFGSFDAEQENLERFKSYFVANHFYETFTSDFPLRIAIGNKGAGKSAVLRASQIEDLGQSDRICVPLRVYPGSCAILTELSDHQPDGGPA